MAFLMYPTQMKDLLAVADANEIMPPKSTWFRTQIVKWSVLHDLETKARKLKRKKPHVCREMVPQKLELFMGGEITLLYDKINC